jgi:hypothetical protein
LKGRAIVATAWLGVGVLLIKPYISWQCGDFTSCSVLLYGLWLFTWLALGFAGGLIWYYWRKRS